MLSELRRAARLVSAPGTPSNRLLRFALGVMTLLMMLIALRNLILHYPVGADIEIPLSAAGRWLAGEPPYLASSFEQGPGYELPFLYPPFVLPIVAPLTLLPKGAVWVLWFAVGLAAACASCRWLAIPLRWWPIVLVWPPFAEAILGGNIQLVLFAAFAGFLWQRPAAAGPFCPIEYDPSSKGRRALDDGVRATTVGALKVSQVQAWAYLLRCRPAAALAGASVLAAVILATLPLTGIELWIAWIEQLRRANDPTWPLVGAGLAAGASALVGIALTGASILAVIFLIPVVHAGAWVGILTIIGSPSLRIFGLLFLLPGMLLVRREIALLSAFFIASYAFAGIWLAVALVAAVLLLGRRFPALLEPERSASKTPWTSGVSAEATGLSRP